MINGQSGLSRIASVFCAALLLLLLAGLTVPRWLPSASTRLEGPTSGAAVTSPSPTPSPAKPSPPPVPQPPPISEVLRNGVLIVISKHSQRMYVFKDGESWASSPVSTGKRGHATPAGVFPILQKRVFHRSNLYSNAPMPHMQRLTWSGIAIHAGRLPGYPASHGCIRLPRAFARSLFALTKASSTTVVITNQALASDSTARTLALNTPMPRPVVTPQQQAVALASASPPRIEPISIDPFPPRVAIGGQTIQLTAAPTPAQAEAHWTRLLASYPELASTQKAVIPAVVGSRQVYRLRTTTPGAHALCASLKRAGEACFNVS